MGTFVYLGLNSLNKRFAELALILEEAKRNSDKNAELYNTLCRAAQVLLSAHLEGYVKDLVKNSLEDLNHYSDFKSANENLKRRACEYFVLIKSDEKDSEKIHYKVKELMSVFDQQNIKLKKEYFVYSDNDNPKVTVLEKTATQFGVKKFFDQLRKSKLDLVFSNTNASNITLCTKLEKYLLKGTKNYPYKIDLSFFEINNSHRSSDNLWDAFLSSLLKRRHDIAHGNEMDNAVGHEIIEADIVKIKILIYAFTAFICDSFKSPESIIQSDL